MSFSVPSRAIGPYLVTMVILGGIVSAERQALAQFGDGFDYPTPEADPEELPQALAVVNPELILPSVRFVSAIRGSEFDETNDRPQEELLQSTLLFPLSKIRNAAFFLHSFDDGRPPAVFSIVHTKDHIDFEEAEAFRAGPDLLSKPFRHDDRSFLITSWRSVVSTARAPELLEPFIYQWNLDSPDHRPVPRTHAPEAAVLYVFLKFQPLRESTQEIRRQFPLLFHQLKQDDESRELAKSIETASFKLWNGVEGDRTILKLSLAFATPAAAEEAKASVETIFAKGVDLLPPSFADVTNARQQLREEAQIDVEDRTVILSTRVPMSPAAFFKWITPAIHERLTPQPAEDNGRAMVNCCVLSF